MTSQAPPKTESARVDLVATDARIIIGGKQGGQRDHRPKERSPISGTGASYR